MNNPLNQGLGGSLSRCTGHGGPAAPALAKVSAPWRLCLLVRSRLNLKFSVGVPPRRLLPGRLRLGSAGSSCVLFSRPCGPGVTSPLSPVRPGLASSDFKFAWRLDPVDPRPVQSPRAGSREETTDFGPRATSPVALPKTGGRLLFLDTITANMIIKES